VETSRFTAEATALGWEPLDATACKGDLDTVVHESSRELYGLPPKDSYAAGTAVAEHQTHYHDVFRATVDGRRVLLANGHTNVKIRINERASDIKGTSVCAVELPAPLPIALIQPRGLHTHYREFPEQATGDAEFDRRFRMTVVSKLGTSDTTPEMRKLIMARDDWIFRTAEALLVSVAVDAYETVDEMRARIDDVLAIVAAIPESTMSGRVDHSTDDLVARIDKIESVEDAIAFLQNLTPDERERLADSGTPLAKFADVTTPEQAMERFESLSQPEQFQLLTTFSRVEEGG
jgi:hypothetical protein